MLEMNNIKIVKATLVSERSPVDDYQKAVFSESYSQFSERNQI